MRHRVHTFKIGRTGSHRRAMLANMVSSLIEHEQIKTTLVKAKEARRFAEKMITLGKRGDLHRRRLAVARLRSKSAVKKLFDDIAPRYVERNGGYTRIIRLGARRGDGAEMCLLQLVEQELAAASSRASVAEAEPAENDVVADAKAEDTAAETVDTATDASADDDAVARDVESS